MNKLLISLLDRPDCMPNLPTPTIWLTVVMFGACSTGIDTDRPDPETNPESTLMLAGSWVPDDPHEIDFHSLPIVPSKHAIVSDVRHAGGTRVHQHNYLAHHDGLFWAMWSDGPGVQRVDSVLHRDRVPGHDRPGQRVSYAVSVDGLDWSVPRDLSGAPDEGFGWIARGFWKRDGKLLSLASHFNAPGYTGSGLELHAFAVEGKDSLNWEHQGIVYDNAMNNFPPKKLPTGEWMMSRRDSVGNVYFLVGGHEAYDRWDSYPIVQHPDSKLSAEEPYWWVLPDDNIVGLFRDNNRSGYLYRSFSVDNGRQWSVPVRTNFPDARSKFCGLRLSDGRYVMVSNPNPEDRDPLCISISDDGTVFSWMGYLVGGRHVDYPHVIEHEGHLYVAFASAKQTVEVLEIRISDLPND